MPDAKIKQARLLPKELWSRCSECEQLIPEFEFSEDFRARLDEVVFRRDRVEIMNELRRESGCNFPTAKNWILHKTYAVVAGGRRVAAP
jgi:hypothetical protein